MLSRQPQSFLTNNLVDEDTDYWELVKMPSWNPKLHLHVASLPQFGTEGQLSWRLGLENYYAQLSNKHFYFI